MVHDLDVVLVFLLDPVGRRGMDRDGRVEQRHGRNRLRELGVLLVRPKNLHMAVGDADGALALIPGFRARGIRERRDVYQLVRKDLQLGILEIRPTKPQSNDLLAGHTPDRHLGKILGVGVRDQRDQRLYEEKEHLPGIRFLQVVLDQQPRSEKPQGAQA